MKTQVSFRRQVASAFFGLFFLGAAMLVWRTQLSSLLGQTPRALLSTKEFYLAWWLIGYFSVIWLILVRGVHPKAYVTGVFLFDLGEIALLVGAFAGLGYDANGFKIAPAVWLTYLCIMLIPLAAFGSNYFAGRPIRWIESVIIVCCAAPMLFGGRSGSSVGNLLAIVGLYAGLVVYYLRTFDSDEYGRSTPESSA